MKHFITILAITFFLAGFAQAAEQRDTSNGLEVVKVFVMTDSKGISKDDLIILLYVKNVSDFPITLLTHNLQDELYLYADRPKELSLNLSTSKSIDGAKVIPSLWDFSPVIINPKEIAEIGHFYKDKRDLKEIVVVYDMLNEWSERFNTWKGRIRSEVIEIKKFEHKK